MPVSTVPGEQWMCYCTGGWFPPEPPWLHSSVRCLKKTLMLCVLQGKQSQNQAVLLWISSIASLQITCARDSFYFCLLAAHYRAGWVRSITSRIALPLRSLNAAWLSVRKKALQHAQHPRSAFVSPADLAKEVSRRTAAAHAHPPALLSRTHSPRIEPHSPRLHPPAIMWTSPPFLPRTLLISLSSSSCRPACFTLNP